MGNANQQLSKWEKMHYIETNVSLEIVQTKGQILKLPEEEEKYE